METSRVRMGACILLLYLCFAPTFFTHGDARKSAHVFRAARTHSKSKKRVNLDISTPLPLPLPLDSTNTQPYGVSSPFSLPPFDSLAPIPLPENTPPFCEYPPFTPTIPTPIGGGSGGGGYTPSSSPPPPSPPPSSSTTPILPILSPPPSPPEIVPSPPTNIPSPSGYIPNPPIYVPSPTEPVLSPPYYEPSPPSYVPRPPPLSYVPSPTPAGHVPVFQPPVVYPPPTVPPPPKSGPSTVLWCVAKPSVPDPIIQEAMNYACGSGADCDSIQPNHPCFQPNTLFAHASYAFNSYWQRTKVAGGTCEFGGTAILVTVDPSYDGCHFVYY